MSAEYNIRGKKVKIDSDGEVFIDGNYSKYKLRKCGTSWHNDKGEITALNGKTIEEALIYAGAI
ncbi:MAG: hypothetical protein LBQ38_02220 [Spirochaetaceae bacterium]|nr:hypothetical protein [Spirochaetaceae bacterium]